MRSRIPIFLLLSVSAVACTTAWRQQSGPVPDAIAAHSGQTVRVVRKSEPTVVLANVAVVGDSVVGDMGRPPQRMAIALSDVQAITVKETDTTVATTGLKVAGVVVVALLALTAIAIHEFAHILDE